MSTHALLPNIRSVDEEEQKGLLGGQTHCPSTRQFWSPSRSGPSKVIVGTPFTLPTPQAMIKADSSLTGWETHLDHHIAQRVWTPQRGQDANKRTKTDGRDARAGQQTPLRKPSSTWRKHAPTFGILIETIYPEEPPVKAPCAVRNLQDLARIYIRRTLRNFINDEMQAKGIPQKPPPKRKRRRYHRRRFSTYVFRGNQLIPEPLDSEEDERMEEDNRDDDDKDHNEALKPEEPPRNLLREKIMSLPLPESLKAYLTYYREK
ncbi:protein-L-isoaspartate O-methyltransferase domain-containing protein 1 [Chelonoidis abingdonii]|uniref:protein-L-isoaspartate O-methyltransferase domain-containing protein 1 n=1 Tax=Chelonoidis abingdonii TaxID=106734 RepID=UPI003F492940